MTALGTLSVKMARNYGAPERLPDTEKVTGPQRKDQDAPTKQDPSPPPEVVRRFHQNADTDIRKESIHHTLGSDPNQASPGRHKHDGGDSVLLLEGYTITGSKASPSTVLPSLIACLVRLGAKDSTT